MKGDVREKIQSPHEVWEVTGGQWKKAQQKPANQKKKSFNFLCPSQALTRHTNYVCMITQSNGLLFIMCCKNSSNGMSIYLMNA